MQQTWRFVVYNRPCKYSPRENVESWVAGKSTAVIAVCQDLSEAERRGASLGKEMLSVMDSAMAAQNIMLAAFAEVWVVRGPLVSPDGVRRLLKLPANIVPNLLISIGSLTLYPDPPRET